MDTHRAAPVRRAKRERPFEPDPFAPIEADLDLDEEDRDGHGGPRIRCPRCAWRPRASDRWSCLCGHVWNTFDTAGRCPGCGYQWEETMCLSCHRWSEHLAWYVDPEDDDPQP